MQPLNGVARGTVIGFKGAARLWCSATVKATLHRVFDGSFKGAARLWCSATGFRATPGLFKRGASKGLHVYGAVQPAIENKVSCSILLQRGCTFMVQCNGEPLKSLIYAVFKVLMRELTS